MWHSNIPVDQWWIIIFTRGAIISKFRGETMVNVSKISCWYSHCLYTLQVLNIHVQFNYVIPRSLEILDDLVITVWDGKQGVGVQCPTGTDLFGHHMGSTQSPMIYVHGAVSPRLQRLWRGGEWQPPSSAFMMYRLIMHRENFIFRFLFI